MSAAAQDRRLTALTLGLFWGAVAAGLWIPGLVGIGHEVAARGLPLAKAWREFHLHLFAPGYNLFLVAVLNAIPFLVLAVFLLLHLGNAPADRHAIVSRRLAGVLGAWLTAFGLSLWVHLDLTLHPDAQGAIALFFLPGLVLLSMPLGYAGGRLVAWLARRGG
jgi:hypothetical protein